MVSLFDNHIDSDEFHFGLESLRQLFKKAKKNNSLPFITGEQDYILLKDFSHFYLRPIYLFKNSQHIFDNELSISEILDEYKIVDNGDEITSYIFVDSEGNRLIQASDIFVGLIGKFTQYVNTNDRQSIKDAFDSLTSKQQINIDLLIDLIDKSHDKNVAFIHSTDSFEEMDKMGLIRGLRGRRQN